MKMEKYLGMQILYVNDRKTAAVFYNRYDMGGKYKVYNIKNNVFKYMISFDNIAAAYKYCDKVY